eukprot:763192-Hanusia_phi.AAC.2
MISSLPFHFLSSACKGALQQGVPWCTLPPIGPNFAPFVLRQQEVVESCGHKETQQGGMRGGGGCRGGEMRREAEYV